MCLGKPAIFPSDCAWVQASPSCAWNLVADMVTTEEIRRLRTVSSNLGVELRQHRISGRVSDIATMTDVAEHVCHDLVSNRDHQAIQEAMPQLAADAWDTGALLPSSDAHVQEFSLLIDAPLLCTASRSVLRPQRDGSMKHLGRVDREPCIAAPLRRGLACAFPRRRYVEDVPKAVSVRCLELIVAIPDLDGLACEAQLAARRNWWILHRGIGAAIVSLLARLPELEQLHIDCSTAATLQDCQAQSAAHGFWEALGANACFGHSVTKLHLIPPRSLNEELMRIASQRDLLGWCRIRETVGCMLRVAQCFPKLVEFDCDVNTIYEQLAQSLGQGDTVCHPMSLY